MMAALTTQELLVRAREEEAGSCEHGRKTPSEYQEAAEELYITSGLLSIKIHVQRTHPNNDKEGEVADGGRHHNRHCILVKKAPNHYADYILPIRNEPPAASPVPQCPLLRKANGQSEFVPWSHRDMEALEKGLPPLGEGANPWIRLFEKYTIGDELALGDMRVLIARLEGTVNLRALEVRTGTTNDDNEAPFDKVRGVFWAAMRNIWPTKPSMSILMGLSMKQGEDMSQYVRRAETEWHLATGERHDNNKSTAVTWRHTVQQGLPQAVQTALEGVVGLDDMDESTWRDHLTHFYKIQRAAETRRQEELGTMTHRLLKIQLAAADAEATKKQRVRKQLSVRDEQPQCPVPPEATYPTVGPAVRNQLRGYQQPPQYRGRDRGREPNRGSGYYQGGYGVDVCLICGQGGHWSRTCPVKYEGNTRLNAPPGRFPNSLQPRQNQRLGTPQPPPPHMW
ncbi:uncharacterized protein LOC144391112 [Gasterosteus aculeatus]